MRAALLLVLRFGLGGLFVVAGVLKGLEPAAFAEEIANYQLWPELAPRLAAMLPAMEVVAGAALLIGPRMWRRAGAAAILLLMVAFTVAVGSAVVRGLDISCGCFGSGSAPVTLWTIARNLALAAAAAVVVWGEGIGRTSVGGDGAGAALRQG